MAKDSPDPGPGSRSRQCIGCEEIVLNENIPNHILRCRPKSVDQKQVCPLCDQQIMKRFFEEHVLSCQDDDNEEEKKTKIFLTKQCPFCHESVEDLLVHIQICENNEENNQSGYETPRGPTPIEMNDNIQSMKSCLLCSQLINEFDYETHIRSCSIDHQSLSQISSSTNINVVVDQQNAMKQCILCSKEMPEIDLEFHLKSCLNEHDELNSIQIENKQCVLCSQEEINQSPDDENHLISCSNLSKQSFHRDLQSSTSNQLIEQVKQCILCYQFIEQCYYSNHVKDCSSNHSDNQINLVQKNENDFIKTTNSIDQDHLTNDFSQSQINVKHIIPSNVERKKDCILCFQSINQSDYIDHVSNCSLDNSHQNKQTNNNHHRHHSKINENHYSTSTSENISKKKDCILCFKAIDQSQYENHVLACLAETEGQPSNSIERSNVKCFTCNRLKKDTNDLYYEIACHCHHNYCLICIQQSMEEFARTRQVPICHRTKCDYELSRHDISSIPLERRLSDRLLKLVKGQQRPFCSKCHFYINLNENDNFDEHYESCSDLIPCEYCQLPYSFEQLEDHTRQCQHDQTSENEKLTHFLLSRTKYPFTKEQIRFFIEQQIKTSRTSFDPHSLIETLAHFGSTFPYDMPTRDCDICMESRPYDDIYVFDCSDNHKLCYSCYYQSCQTKMQNGEILTCAICTNPLRDGELNQLRIPIDQLKAIRDYQMKKTFEIYSSRTRGIIKCPKPNCTWIAEADDPNDRFKVNCPICFHEFCSLCNQQYHYRTTCQQLPQITQRWFFWCQNERNRYLTMRAEQDASYAAQLNDYNRQHDQNENRNRDLRRRYDELMNDEQYKVTNCRLCPQCHRVVQRLEGCDSMICGQDAHGGNVQSGCGATFNWTQAQPYQASTTKQLKQILFDLPQPNNPIVHHQGVKCDQCQRDVNGIRFDCVHCPSLTFCDQCEQQATLNHSKENQFLQQQQHVFKLIMTPEEEEAILL